MGSIKKAFDLTGKTALVTGGSRGLGLQIAEALGEQGAKIVLSSRKAGDLEEAQKHLAKLGIESDWIAADNSKDEDIKRLADGAIAKLGKVDILVNNAGILLDGTFAKMTEANWDRVMKVHLKGTFCVTLPVFKWMKDNGGGVIVNTSSTSGLLGNFGQSNYGAAKGGIWGLSNVLAIEGRKYNIRLWTLAPGALTRMTADLPRYIENPGAAMGPDEIAPAVLYMVSSLSGEQTGKVLGVSGPRGVREMKMLEMEGWKPGGPWKAQDILSHAKEIFFDEQDKMAARRF